MTLPRLWVLMTVAAAFMGPASSPIGLPDIFWTLQSGQWMVAHGRLLDFDPFTSAPHVSGAVLNVQWLADLAYYWLDASGGLALVIVGTAVAVMVTYAIVLAAAITASGHLRLSCVAVWAAYALGVTNLSSRPQTLAYPLFAVFLLAIVRAEWRQDRRLLWLLPLLTVIWANVHGSFFTGWLLLACAAGGRLLQRPIDWRGARPYLATLIACVLASMVTPYGPGSLVYLVHIGSNPIVRDFVTEWAPTTIESPGGVLFFGAVALVAGLMLRARLRLTRFELLTMLAFGLLAWTSVRSVVWFGLVIAPTLARLLASALPRRRTVARERPLLNSAIALAVVALAALSTPWIKSAVPFLPADKQTLVSPVDAPAGVGNYLSTHDPPPTGTMLNFETWGGYLNWAAWPRHQAFVDGRIELHPTQVWLDYVAIVFPKAGWRTLLDQYDISYLVLSTAEVPELVDDLRVDPGWRLDYEDAQAVVFTRSAVPPP